MWYVLEYKKTATARTWHFAVAGGDKATMESQLLAYQQAGIVARLRESQEPK